MKRSDIFRSLSFLPFAGGLLGTLLISKSAKAALAVVKRNLYKESGVRNFINAAGTYTVMIGSLIPYGFKYWPRYEGEQNRTFHF